MAATVVAPSAPRAAASGRSRTLSLAMSVVAMRRQPVLVEADVRLAVEHGDRRRHRAGRGTAASSSRATSRLRGRGRPWAMIVDSSATTAPPRVERLADRLAEREHYRAAAEEATDGGDAAADDEAGDGGADEHLLLVLGDLLAPVGDLGHLAAQPRERVRELHAVGLDRGADLLGRAGRHG